MPIIGDLEFSRSSLGGGMDGEMTSLLSSLPYFPWVPFSGKSMSISSYPGLEGLMGATFICGGLLQDVFFALLAWLSFPYSSGGLSPPGDVMLLRLGGVRLSGGELRGLHPCCLLPFPRESLAVSRLSCIGRRSELEFPVACSSFPYCSPGIMSSGMTS